MQKKLYYKSAGVVLAIAVLIIFMMYVPPPTKAPPANSMQNINPSLPTRTLVINSSDSIGSLSWQAPSTTLTVEIADTDAARVQGLSGRSGLLPSHGMLFIFDTPGDDGFWMKDMQFSLDIIFADADGRVVTVDQNLSPDSYNAANPQSSQIFYHSSPARYVLEVPAGFAAEQNIKVGSQLQLQ